MEASVMVESHPWRRSLAAAELLLCVAPLAVFTFRVQPFLVRQTWYSLSTGVPRWLPQLVQEGVVLLFWAMGSLFALAAVVALLVSVIRHGVPTFKAWQLAGLLVGALVVVSVGERLDNILGLLPFTIATAVATSHQLLDAWCVRRQACQSA
jgi:hypothetical protein